MVLGVATGCASSGGGSAADGADPAADEGGATGSIRVVVENRINPPQSLTVTITSDGGTRRVLGSAGPGRTTTLGFEHGAFGGESYRLIAQTQSGDEIVSTPFRLFVGAEISWSLPRNGVTVAR